MWPESREQQQPLRSGLTTGSCATACCVAAAQALLANKRPASVDITLPKGKVVSLGIEAYELLDTNSTITQPVIAQPAIPQQDITKKAIRTSTIKDAGDDPDVTHGAVVFVELTLVAKPGLRFLSADGVGTVTREGLVLGVGEPAINPVPRQMMKTHLENTALVYAYTGGFEVAVGVKNGQALALKTMNPRLGIVGGLSILGTTGIVRPYSCAAYIASIHQGIDVATANGLTHIAATTGSTSEAAIRERYHLNEMALIEMGDFVGAVLKHLRKLSIEKAPNKKTPIDKLSIKKVSICGGFGKISKLANGHMDLNSRASSIDFEQLAHLAKKQGADAKLLTKIRKANTSMQVYSLCQSDGIKIGDALCEAALAAARRAVKTTLTHKLLLEVWAVDRQGNFVGFASEKSSDEPCDEVSDEPL